MLCIERSCKERKGKELPEGVLDGLQSKRGRQSAAELSAQRHPGAQALEARTP